MQGSKAAFSSLFISVKCFEYKNFGSSEYCIVIFDGTFEEKKMNIRTCLLITLFSLVEYCLTVEAIPWVYFTSQRAKYVPILAVRRHEKNWFMLQQTNRLFPIFTIIYGSLSAQCGLKRATLALFIECVLIWPCSVYCPQCSASFGCLFVTTSADPHHLCLPTYGWIDSL